MNEELPEEVQPALKASSAGFSSTYNEETVVLQSLGFAAPTDVSFSFPDSLEKGTDYDYTYDAVTGDLKITVKALDANGGAERW